MADLFEAYNETIMQLNTLQINRISGIRGIELFWWAPELFGKP